MSPAPEPKSPDAPRAGRRNAEPIAVVAPPRPRPPVVEEPRWLRRSAPRRLSSKNRRPRPPRRPREPRAPPAPRVRSMPPPTGRVVPPTLRLRVEDPMTGEAPPAPPRRPMLVRPPAPPRRRPPQAPTGNLSRPAGARPGPGGAGRRRASAAASGGGLPPRQAPLGGPRPLPSQPVRPPRAAAAGRDAGLSSAAAAAGGRARRRSAPRSRAARAACRRPRRRAPPPVTRTITLAEGMTVNDLATKLDVKAKDVLKKLMDRRMMMTINTTLDDETASMIAREFGADVLMQSFEEEMLQVETEDVEPGRRRHARAGRHRHGPRRPRQDDAARRDPLDARRRARSRRHHAAHRRVRGARSTTATSSSSTRPATKRSR